MSVRGIGGVNTRIGTGTGIGITQFVRKLRKKGRIIHFKDFIRLSINNEIVLGVILEDFAEMDLFDQGINTEAPAMDIVFASEITRSAGLQLASDGKSFWSSLVIGVNVNLGFTSAPATADHKLKNKHIGLEGERKNFKQP
ncbi:hypothetical protein K1719_012684 [Acacia pycnantha]|nr:hypothetical protein K1719_012684 [Acacia pycnantha]